MNNYYNHANIKSPCPTYIDIESPDGRTMPERRSFAESGETQGLVNGAGATLLLACGDPELLHLF